MRFVLGNRLMTGVGGTEVHLVTIADHLRRLGHEATIYSPELGPYAEHARGRGLDVTGDLDELPACDVVLSQDSLVAYDLAEHFPEARHIFRVCGDVYDFQLPPQVSGVVDALVVLSDRYARVAEACEVTAPVVRLRVPVDVDLRVPLTKIRPRPRRAVLLGNYGDRYDLVRRAWEPHGVEVRTVGSANGGRQSFDLAESLAEVDIVVAKSRAALEAMSCGRAVYVFDVFGGDGWVTPEAYPPLEADNFAGQATGAVIGRAELERDLAAYDPAMGSANRDLVLQHHNARDHVIELLRALERLAPAKRPDAPLRELARLEKLQWSWETIAGDLRRQHGWLHTRALEAEAAAEEARAAAEQADAASKQLERELADTTAVLHELQATRAWRLAGRYWRLKQRLRR